ASCSQVRLTGRPVAIEGVATTWFSSNWWALLWTRQPGRSAGIDRGRRCQREGRWGRPRCDATPSSGAPARSSRGPLEQLLDRGPGRHRCARQAVAPLEPRDLAAPRMDLPVPVERGVDALPQRRRVEHEVVRRPVKARTEGAEPVAEGFCGGADGAL